MSETHPFSGIEAEGRAFLIGCFINPRLFESWPSRFRSAGYCLPFDWAAFPTSIICKHCSASCDKSVIAIHSLGMLIGLGWPGSMLNSTAVADLSIEPRDFVGIAGLSRQELEREDREIVGQVFRNHLYIFRGFWLARLIANQLKVTVLPSLR